jgi:hypothetical protein
MAFFSSCITNETNKAAFSGSLVGCKQMLLASN